MNAIQERAPWLGSPLASAVILSGLGVAVLALLRLVDPRVPGNYPTCPFLLFTGCYCPGCGTLRALATLMEGDLRSAMGYNPLTVLSLPVLSTLNLMMVARKNERLTRLQLRVPPLAAWTLLAVIISFWALRNIPLYPLSMLAP